MKEILDEETAKGTLAQSSSIPTSTSDTPHSLVQRGKAAQEEERKRTEARTQALHEHFFSPDER